MPPLRQRMLDDMQLRGLALKTQAAYALAVRQLAEHYDNPHRQSVGAETGWKSAGCIDFLRRKMLQCRQLRGAGGGV